MRCALCLLAMLIATGCGSSDSGRSWVVHPDGRIGPLELDLSTDADVRDFAGKPFEVAKVYSETKPDPVGYELHYHCGRGCITSYAISYATGKLADFVTQSPQFVTERGSRVGMPAKRAAAREDSRIVGACGEGSAIQLRWDERHVFVLGVFARRVSLITYLGPHTLSYEGLC